MGNTTVITSFTIMVTAEGTNVSYTYSEIDANGKKVVENERRTFIATEPATLTSIDEIRKYVLEKHKNLK